MVNHPPLVWRNHGQSEAKIWHSSTGAMQREPCIHISRRKFDRYSTTPQVAASSVSTVLRSWLNAFGGHMVCSVVEQPGSSRPRCPVWKRMRERAGRAGEYYCRQNLSAVASVATIQNSRNGRPKGLDTGNLANVRNVILRNRRPLHETNDIVRPALLGIG
jgi:hypothetical protein